MISRSVVCRRGGASPRLQLDPIAQRADLPLGRGLEVLASRATVDFTAFDGNVAEVLVSAGDVQRLFETARMISASTSRPGPRAHSSSFWGGCYGSSRQSAPKRHGRSIHLNVARWCIASWSAFSARCKSAGGCLTRRPIRRRIGSLMDEIADACIADLERRGVTGHPLVWENTVATIRADLRVFLTKDESWRLNRSLRPAFFEQPSASRGSARSWPPLALRVGDLEVAFRGTIDRIDVTTNGQRAFLYDYKTGGASGYRDLEDDPLMAGRHVQLALYRRAVLASMPELDEEDVDGAFWFVSSRGEFKMLPSEPSEHDIDQRLEDVLDVAARGIRGGIFPQVPGAETSRLGPVQLGQLRLLCV